MSTRKRQSGETRTTAAEPGRMVDDAIAFLHSMLKLVENRGLLEVDEEFANAVLGMTERILNLSAGRDDTDARVVRGIEGAWEFFEAFECVPTTVFKDVMLLVETSIREESEEISDAERAA